MFEDSVVNRQLKRLIMINNNRSATIIFAALLKDRLPIAFI